jgi:hypothetical protein
VRSGLRAAATRSSSSRTMGRFSILLCAVTGPAAYGQLREFLVRIRAAHRGLGLPRANNSYSRTARRFPRPVSPFFPSNSLAPSFFGSIAIAYAFFGSGRLILMGQIGKSRAYRSISKTHRKDHSRLPLTHSFFHAINGTQPF